MPAILTPKKETIKPTLGNLLIKPLSDKEEKFGNIIIPGTAGSAFRRGEVIDIGPGELTINGTRLPMPAKKGDIVLFYTCNRVIRVNSIELELVAHTEVHAVVEPG